MSDLALMRARAKAKLKLRSMQEPDVEASQPDVSKTESALRGAAQGASFGFSDEAGGVGSALYELLHGDDGEATGKLDRLRKAYRAGRDDERGENKKAEEAHPTISTVSKLAGSALPAVLTGGSMAANVATGAIQGAGESNAEDLTDLAKDSAVGGGSAAALSALFKVAPGLAKKLGIGAEKMAEKATGATGAFAEKNFKPGLGRKLLDEGYIKPFSNPEGLAGRLQKGLEKAGSGIDEAISGMDKSGQIIDKEKVISALNKKIESMASDPSQAPIIKKLQGFIDDIRATPANVEAIEGGVEGFTPSLAEKTKRGYQSLSNYTDPEKTQAVKHAANVFKEEVEGAAERASPEIAEKFSKSKADWGMLAPAEEAASKRTAQLQQSPLGGLLDTAAATAGEVARGGAGIPLAIARRVGAPRLAQTVSYGLDKSSKLLGKEVPGALKNVISRLPDTLTTDELPENQNIPIERMGKYSSVLMKAKERGPQALASTNYILSMSDPDYREALKQQKGE